MKLGMYVMAHESISIMCFMNFSLSLCVCMCIILSLLGNSLVKRYHGNDYTSNSRRIVGGIIFYAVHVVSNNVCDQIFPRTSCSLYKIRIKHDIQAETLTIGYNTNDSNLCLNIKIPSFLEQGDECTCSSNF